MLGRARGARRLLPLATLVLAASLFPSAASAGAAAGSMETVPAAAVAPFTLDLSTRDDFVAQTNFVQCVGASMQMMLNMIRAADDRTAATQADLQVLARSLSGQRPDGRVRKGASVVGWTAGLNQLDAGPYRTTGDVDLQATLRLAARAMRETNRPVGLLVWRGRHAWVMAGFSATADPRYTSDFEVTQVVVLDPLYPHGSSVWGASPKPRQALAVAELARQFVPRGSRGALPGGDAGQDLASSWSQGFSGKYVIVMPYVAPPRAWTPGRVAI